jgi:hypothetical protein
MRAESSQGVQDLAVARPIGLTLLRTILDAAGIMRDEWERL